MKHYYSLIFLFTLFFTSQTLFAQNGLCSEIEPLCLTNNTIIFPNCFDGNGDCTEAAEVGPDYGCLGSLPFPTWQYIAVNQSGDLEFLITQNIAFNNDENPISSALDVDFIVWGPFGENDALCDYNNLSTDDIVDCSFSVQAEESMTILNAIAGERYVVLITNFSELQGFIKIEQTGGTGATVCTTSTDTTFVACEGDTLGLQASVQNAVNYQWLLFDGNDFVIIPNETTAFLDVTQDGLYRVSYTLSDNTIVDEDLTVIFNSTPALVAPSDYVICDDENNDGIAEFMLSLKDAEITNGDTNLVITYFETEADAFANVAPLFDLYTNVAAFTQTLYARGENTLTGCFAVVPLELIVVDSPVIVNDINNIEIDDPDNDGFEIVDLTINEAQILGAQDPTDFVITYHFTMAQAILNANPIVAPTTFTNITNPQVIFVRLENVNTECFAVGDFLIILSSNSTDSDSDGIPDDDEDLNGNGDLEDDDTDEDSIPNYLDNDDDGDSVNTIIEIQGEGAGIVPQDFIDTDDDMIENYLDNDDDGDTILTIDEDYNNNGSPLDDDINMNGIPDFLDPDVALSVTDITFTDLSIYPNPTRDILQIVSPSFTQDTSIRVYDIHGREIGKYTLDSVSNTVEVDLSNVASGIYFVYVTSGKKSITRQVIKQ